MSQKVYCQILRKFDYSYPKIKQEINKQIESGKTLDEIAIMYGYKNKQSMSKSLEKYGFYLFDNPERLLKKVQVVKRYIRQHGGNVKTLMEVKDMVKKTTMLSIVFELMDLSSSQFYLMVYQLDRDYLKYLLEREFKK